MSATEVTALIERFDYLRNSGVCSPTTRGLLDSAQELLTRTRGTVTDAESIISALSDFSRFGPLGYREQKIAEAAIALARA